MTMPPLSDAELVLEGRILPASNATFYGHLGDTAVVYKPVAGERPLWDFPGAVLAHREVAAYLVSESLGWSIVPPTWLGDGPHGEGMIQAWQETDPGQDPVTIVPAGEVPQHGWRHVLDGVDADERPVSVVHEDSASLRQMAIFDALVNNADRKGGHVLAMAGGHRYGVDHGLTFHTDPKLRTVLWGWVGEPLTDEELSGVDEVITALDGDLGGRLGELLAAAEVEGLRERAGRLRTAGRFPSPEGDMPAVPWPPF